MAKYPCELFEATIQDKSNCPDNGCSDCPLTVEGAECQMTEQDLEDTLRYCPGYGCRRKEISNER